jgi:hypothetical protein
VRIRFFIWQCSFVAGQLSDLGRSRLQGFVIDTVPVGAAASARASTKMRNLHPPSMKKLLLLPLLVVACLVSDTSVRVMATTATSTTESTLANISTRALVQTGDNVVIGGFIVQGAQPKRVIIRALGPELTQYGIPNALANPTLELYDGTGALIASNNNWATTIIGGIITSNQVHEIQASGYAPGDPTESAIIADLPEGSYTAIVRGVNNNTGVALVEVYNLQ